jgi:hypothetical protein
MRHDYNALPLIAMQRHIETIVNDPLASGDGSRPPDRPTNQLAEDQLPTENQLDEPTPALSLQRRLADRGTRLPQGPLPTITRPAAGSLSRHLNGSLAAHTHL